VDRLGERAVGIEARDLVFVLIGHHFEGVARDRERKAALARGLGLLGRGDFINQRPVAVSVGAVLVGGEEIGALGDDFGERLGFLRRRRFGEAGDRRRVSVSSAAP